MRTGWALAVAAAFVGACASAPESSAPSGPVSDRAYPGFEAISFFGDELQRPELETERRRTLEADLAGARRELERNPNDAASHIWVGRRLGYLGRYREAVDVFTAAIREFPESYRLLRHRGHRNITLRRLDAAVDDLSRAAALAYGAPDEVEPDGAPNEWGVPRSTDQSNIYYHLGLALYLRGEYEEAVRAYEDCLEHAVVNNDMLVATLYWLSNARGRLEGRGAAVRVAERAHSEMMILENHAYHELLLARAAGTSEELFASVDEARGEESIDWLTTAYGVSVSRELDGDAAGARALRERIIDAEMWPAFGFIAAEADLARETAP